MLHIPAIRNLEEEDVVAGGGEKVAQVSPQPQASRVGVIGPVLRPYEIEQAPRPVLPPQDDGAPQGFIIEIRVPERERLGRAARAVRVDRGDVARIIVTDP